MAEYITAAEWFERQRAAPRSLLELRERSRLDRDEERRLAAERRAAAVEARRDAWERAVAAILGSARELYDLAPLRSRPVEAANNCGAFTEETNRWAAWFAVPGHHPVGLELSWDGGREAWRVLAEPWLSGHPKGVVRHATLGEAMERCAEYCEVPF